MKNQFVILAFCLLGCLVAVAYGDLPGSGGELVSAERLLAAARAKKKPVRPMKVKVCKKETKQPRCIAKDPFPFPLCPERQCKYTPEYGVEVNSQNYFQQYLNPFNSFYQKKRKILDLGEYFTTSFEAKLCIGKNKICGCSKCNCANCNRKGVKTCQQKYTAKYGMYYVFDSYYNVPDEGESDNLNLYLYYLYYSKYYNQQSSNHQYPSYPSYPQYYPSYPQSYPSYPQSYPSYPQSYQSPAQTGIHSNQPQNYQDPSGTNYANPSYNDYQQNQGQDGYYPNSGGTMYSTGERHLSTGSKHSPQNKDSTPWWQYIYKNMYNNNYNNGNYGNSYHTSHQAKVKRTYLKVMVPDGCECSRLKKTPKEEERSIEARAC